MNDQMKDFLTFKKMITPIIIQVLFWIAVVVVVIFGFYTMFATSFFQGLLMVVFGPIVYRILFEMMIVMFKMNDTLTDIKNNTKKEA
jgi:hypothetical protein